MTVDRRQARSAAGTAPQKIQVFSLGRPREGVARDRRRYYAKWRIDGRDRTRAFKTRAEADRFRSGLLLAVRDGQGFDSDSGLPSAWTEPANAMTWWIWSRQWIATKWPQWSGHSRRTGIETLAMFAPRMVRPDAPPPPPGLGVWLRGEGYRPDTDPRGNAAAWLGRWSVPLDEIQPDLLEDVLDAVSRRADGQANVPAVIRRRQNMLGAILRSAVRRGVLQINPMDRTEWQGPTHNPAVDVSTVPSPEDVAAVVDHVAAMPGRANRCTAVFALVGMAGMRPSEALGVKVDDLDLPTTGWGLASLRGAITSPGGRYTNAGTAVESKGLKHRSPGTVRDVPLSPTVITILRRHLAAFEPIDGRVFSNLAGRPMTAGNYGAVWGRARAALWPEGHPLAGTTVYDLRHAAATMLLQAKVPPAEVSRRLGHSVDVLMRVYAGVFSDERERSNALIDAASRPPPPRRS